MDPNQEDQEEQEEAFYVTSKQNSKVFGKRVNIDGSDDPYNHYKVPQLQIQIVQKGEKMKTMLLNLEEVARALCLQPDYMVAFLGYGLDTKFKYDMNRQRASLNGEYTCFEINGVMSNMINEYVLCDLCRLPEQNIPCRYSKNPKQGTINTSCNACGKKKVLEVKDDKFLQFIYHNPPMEKSRNIKPAK
mmetsp:Transcript_29894/g.46275  ORF Transcript_29894/g.46275 Transcript_29894/m.46275 type:complete len:189 (-) Transcript_29894:129-695(-)